MHGDMVYQSKDDRLIERLIDGKPPVKVDAMGGPILPDNTSGTIRSHSKFMDSSGKDFKF